MPVDAMFQVFSLCCCVKKPKILNLPSKTKPKTPLLCSGRKAGARERSLAPGLRGHPLSWLFAAGFVWK